MANLRIEFNNNHTGHNDIILKISNPKTIRKFDSFYFIIEEEPKTINAAQLRLTELLQFWIQEINSLSTKGIKYLPISFSENFLGVFKIKNNNNTIEFEYGFLQPIKGDQIKPSYPIINLSEISFISDKKVLAFQIEKLELISDIEESIKIILQSIL